MVMENLTYDYTITNLTGIDKDGYIDVIETIFYTIITTHSDGRTASVTDSYKLDLGNLGYNGFYETSTLTTEDVKKWLVRAMPGRLQETENKNELQRLIRSQEVPGSKTINL